MLRLVGSFVCLATMICGATALVGATSPGSDTPAAESTAVHQLVPWLLEEDRQLRGIPFSALIADVTGKKVMAFDRKNEVDQRVVGGIGAACDQAMKQLNAPGSAIQKVGRINEVSSYFEQTLRDLLNSTPGLSCDFPPTAQGKVQRFGYPDLRVVDLASKRVFYLDAKLIAAGATALCAHFISNPKSRPIRCAMTRCISSPVSSTSRVSQPVCGNSPAGTLSILPASK